MRTEYVTVVVEYCIPVDVADDATNEEVLDRAEQEYADGELGTIETHTMDPFGEYHELQEGVE
jgi:hypothetical protein